MHSPETIPVVFPEPADDRTIVVVDLGDAGGLMAIFRDDRRYSRDMAEWVETENARAAHIEAENARAAYIEEHGPEEQSDEEHRPEEQYDQVMLLPAPEGPWYIGHRDYDGGLAWAELVRDAVAVYVCGAPTNPEGARAMPSVISHPGGPTVEVAATVNAERTRVGLIAMAAVPGLGEVTAETVEWTERITRFDGPTEVFEPMDEDTARAEVARARQHITDVPECTRCGIDGMAATELVSRTRTEYASGHVLYGPWEVAG